MVPLSKVYPRIYELGQVPPTAVSRPNPEATCLCKGSDSGIGLHLSIEVLHVAFYSNSKAETCDRDHMACKAKNTVFTI